jgi:hypothetical protein
MSLIEERDYDRIDILAPEPKSPRSQLAFLAAQVAVSGSQASSIMHRAAGDLSGMLEIMQSYYDRYYTRGNFDIELALTGSKMHAVACGAASSALRFAQCWYVAPREFDSERFTHGVGTTRYYMITTQRL